MQTLFGYFTELTDPRVKDSKRAVHIVSARSKSNQLSLGQVGSDEKSNEITAIPGLLEVLALQGCPVTIDATGCQRDIAAQIIKKEADYLLAVKECEINRILQF